MILTPFLRGGCYRTYLAGNRGHMEGLPFVVLCFLFMMWVRLVTQ